MAALGGLVALVCAQTLLMPAATPDARLLSVAFYAAATIAFGGLLRATYTHATLGLCNVVTLGRLIIVSALVTPLFFHATSAWLVVVLSGVVLVLDGIDGWLARRDNLVSSFGARFDVEVDSAFALILALHVLLDGKAGAIVLLLGLVRYAFVLAGIALPWLNAPLPPRFGRKLVCVVQLTVLIALQLPFVTSPVSDLLVLATIALVLWSFGRDILWLRRSRA